MRLLTETTLAVLLAAVIATTFAQCVAHVAGDFDPARGGSRPGGPAAEATQGGDPASAREPASAAPKLRCPAGPTRASEPPRRLSCL